MAKQLFNNDKPYASTNAFKKTRVFRPPGNMYYMDANIVKPLTMPLKLSYAELVGPQDAMWFVSHWWGCLVLNLRVSRCLEEIPELPIIPS